MMGYRLHRQLDLTKCLVEDIDESSPEFDKAPPHSFKILSNHKSFITACPDAAAKTEWLQDIRNAIVTTQSSNDVSQDAVKAAVAPVWIPDRAAHHCLIEDCMAPFTLRRRRHHCRMCGIMCCANCSKERRILRNIDHKPVRVCKSCVRGTSRGQQALFHLQVRVEGCHDLPAADSNGLSDPYVRIFCEQQLQGQTSVVKETLHPKWSHAQYDFVLKNLPTAEVQVEVYDWDLLGDDDFLGQATVPVADLVRLAGKGKPHSFRMLGQECSIDLSCTLKPPLALEAADDPCAFIRMWEDKLATSVASEALVLAVDVLYKEGIRLSTASGGKKKEFLGRLQRHHRIFENKPEVRAVLQPKAADSSHAGGTAAGGGAGGGAGAGAGAGGGFGDAASRVTSLSANSKASMRQQALTGLVAAETDYVRDLDTLLTVFVKPLADVTAGASLSARKATVRRETMGGPRKRKTLMGGMFTNKRKDRETEAALRRGDVAVLWSSLQQLATLNTKLLNDLQERMDSAPMVGSSGVGDIAVNKPRQSWCNCFL